MSRHVANEEPSRVVRRAARARISAGLLVRLYRHLNKSRQRQFLMLIALMLVSALAEVVSLGAVLPFIGILASDRKSVV